MYDILAPHLPIIWAALIGTAVALYVILDGFDLGLGILFPLTRDEEEHDRMMNTVAPFWDGNETWLVLGGGGLWVAFPKAYAAIMSALYLPVILMLLALVFRGVAFEFRFVAKPHHRFWDIAFAGGSAVAAFAQGLVLGGLVQGIRTDNGAFTGGALDWATPFAFVTGLGVVAGYALLGATWLAMKTDGALAERARQWGMMALGAVVAAMGVISLWTALGNARVAALWFRTPSLWPIYLIPLVTFAAIIFCQRGIEARRDVQPFAMAIVIFLTGYLGLVVSNFPYLVPPSLTVGQASAAPESQFFLLVGTLVLLPIVLGYTAFIYRTFSGKVRAGDGYH
jgi:cytochrome d ubiquinol oxidase subunit II